MCIFDNQYLNIKYLIKTCTLGALSDTKDPKSRMAGKSALGNI